MRIEWSTHALSDLHAISDYIERDRNLETANRVTRSIYEAILSLRTLPYRGRPGRVENTRELVVPKPPYVIIYQPFETRVVVLNVLHGAQRWP